MKTRKRFSKILRKYSNPKTAQYKATRYLGKSAKLYPARNSAKKYSVFDDIHRKWVNFGQIGYEDFTKHGDLKRRRNYLVRTNSIRGNWKRNKYSANNLSREILW